MSTVSIAECSAIWSGSFDGDAITGEIPWPILFAGVDVEEWVDGLIDGLGSDGSLFIEIVLPCGAVVHVEAGCADGCTDIHSVTVLGDIEPSGLTGCWVS